MWIIPPTLTRLEPHPLLCYGGYALTLGFRHYFMWGWPILPSMAFVGHDVIVVDPILKRWVLFLFLIDLFYLVWGLFYHISCILLDRCTYYITFSSRWMNISTCLLYYGIFSPLFCGCLEVSPCYYSSIHGFVDLPVVLWDLSLYKRL